MSDNLLFNHFFTPVIFLAIAFILPQCKQIGPVGYRTPRSMKNQENWDYSQKLSGQLLLIFGLTLLLVNTLFYFAILPSMYFTLVEMILIGGGLLSIILYTEYRLYRFEKSSKI
ncbi:SdpI family protein [Myroides sp. DF42-4-2]|uniref:SdpI family protein n=1 Tax=unclassified Myroides TaxID=2642485 RepID=UPI00257523D7|nr:SdpI family protein [Myroides sp. DF42-4-2]